MGISTKNLETFFQDDEDTEQLIDNLGSFILDEFNGIKLIGQIDIEEGEETYNFFKDNLALFPSLFDSIERLNLKNHRGKKLRAILSLYFVWTGIFYYGEESGHELWPKIFDGLGYKYEPTLSQKWGSIFYETIKENGLQTFGRIQSNHPYVTSILLHGLIPLKHTKYFIKELLLKDIKEGKHQTPESLREKWLYSNSYMPKPIMRFLKYGDDIAVNLISHFLDMANNWDNNLEKWWQWGLPKYMVKAFSECLSEYDPAKKGNKRETLYKKSFYRFDFSKEDYPVLISSPSEEEISIEPNDIINKDPEIFPIGKVKKRIPILFFNSETGKLINPNKIKKGEYLIVYPNNAILQLSNGTVETEEMALGGKWKEWKLLFCTVNENFIIDYYGPSLDFDDIIEETIRINISNISDIILSSEDIAPPWFRCNDIEEIPVFFKVDKLTLSFPKGSFNYWKRGSIRLYSIFYPEKVQSIRVAEAKLCNNEWKLYLSIENPIPGIYELYLKGILGTGEWKKRFVYLPINKYEKINYKKEPHIAEKFILYLGDNISFQNGPKTKISISSNKRIDITLEEDNDEAFCTLKAFTDTKRPVTFLLERNPIKWVRHSESGPIEWKDWRIRPEIIPIQRVKELQDSRVKIEINANYHKCPHKLKLILTGDKGNNKKDVLMSYEAPKFKRGIHTQWIIDLKRFSSQLMDISGYCSAQVLVDLDNKPYTLFTLLRYPEYKDFTIRTERLNKSEEVIKIYWSEQANEPRKNRVLKIYSKKNTENSLLYEIPNEEHPPIILSIDPVQKPEVWCAEIGIKERRFQENFINKTEWLRAPNNWYDWIKWSKLSIKEYPRPFEPSEYELKDCDIKFMPWTFFIYTFHFDYKPSTLIDLQNILGEKLLLKLIPFSKNSIWVVKSYSTKKDFLKLRVISPINSLITLLEYVKGIRPADLYTIPDKVEVGIELLNDTKYLGKKGTIWKYIKMSKRNKALMISEEGKLEIDVWLEDATDEMGCYIQSHIPLKHIWDNPPDLPILNKINLTDKVHNHYGILGEKLAERYNIHKVRDQAFDLVKEWQKWLENSEDNINRLLYRMLCNRLNSISILTGSVALFYRLKASGKQILRSQKTKNVTESEELLNNTISFVKEYLPRSYLRDLILSEILINWYWDKIVIKA